MTRSLVWLVPFTLVACGPDLTSDLDEDGLTLEEETELGTDPDKADSDGDGLADKAEIDLGYNPIGNTLGEPYKGGWPLQAAEVKDAVEANKRPGAMAEVGKRFPRLSFKDQFGDLVDIYDYAGQGKAIIVDVSAEWCPPCQQASNYLAGEELLWEYTDGSKVPQSDALRDAVANGDVFWLTFMVQNNAGEAPTFDVIERWDESYPNENIPVFFDKKQETEAYVISATGGFPSFAVLNENMIIKSVESGYSPDSLDALANAKGAVAE